MKRIRVILFFLCFIVIVVQGQNLTSPFNQSKFVPDISFIMDFSYISRDIDNDIYSRLFTPDFTHHHQYEDASHEHSSTTRGFNFNYGELSLSSVVDPYFDLFAVIHFAPDHIEMEEAYFTTRSLPLGFQIKAGKFLSGFGRINEQHSHYLDFAERPLIVTSFFGDEGLNEIGARMSWVAPTQFYLMFGGELLMGENEGSFGKTNIEDPNGRLNIHTNENPSLFVGYARTSFDIGEASILFGTSLAHGLTRHNEDFSSTEAEGSALDAITNIYGVDLTVKYIIDAIRSITFQNEALYRITDGTSYHRINSTIETGAINEAQCGIYSQLISKLGLQWRAGVRYDALAFQEVSLDGQKENLPTYGHRFSGMIEYSPTEFSRFRLQINHDRSKYYFITDSLLSHKPFTEVILQCTNSIGAHGAHSF
jgi:hypothetical protein